MKGLREHINIVLAVVGVVVLILLYGIARVDQLSEKVADLPGKISAELRDISKTLAENITAAKTPPQIIVVPQPTLPQTPSAPQPPSPPSTPQ